MPYCPKCDMEFVEGITKCTDCGGPLFESKEAADEFMRQNAAKQNEMLRKQYERMMAMAAQEEAAAKAAEANGQVRRQSGPATAYVDKSQRYDDLNSSAIAFTIVGGAAAIVLVLSLAGVINLPFTGIMKYIVIGMLLFMTVGSIIVAVSSKKSAGEVKTQVAGEKKETEEIINWFVEKYDASDIDRRILFTESGLSEEEMSLRRFEWIQDLLITGKDLTDQSYVDMLCDEIYARLFEKDN